MTSAKIAELFVLIVKVLLLLVVPVTVIKSRTANPAKLVVVDVILYSVPVAVKLISVPVTFVIYSVFFLLNLAVFGPSPYTAASSFGSCPSTVKIFMYLIL